MPRKQPEEQLQAAIVAWARLRAATCPDLEVLYHPPNGGFRSKAEAGRFKVAGVRPGVSDLHLPASFSAGIPGLWMELKAPAGTLSAAQLDWLSRMFDRGERVGLVRTPGAALMVLSWHLNRPDLLRDVMLCERLTRGTTTLGLLSYRFHALGVNTLDALQMTREQGKKFDSWVGHCRAALIEPAVK